MILLGESYRLIFAEIKVLFDDVLVSAIEAFVGLFLMFF